MCFDFLYKSVWNISHSEKNSARYYHKCTWLFMESNFYSCQTSYFNFLDRLSELLKYQTSWKSVHGSRLVPYGHTGGRTDMTKLIVAFPNFTNTPKNVQLWRHYISIYCNSLHSSVSPTFLLTDPSWFRKITTDSHIPTHVTIVCPDDGYPKSKIYIS